MSAEQYQILKVSDDIHPVTLQNTTSDSATSFRMIGDSSWARNDEIVDTLKLRSRIEPWLTALFQSEHLNLIIGSGLSSSIQKTATGQLPNGMSWINDLSIYKNEIELHIKKAAKKAGRQNGNIEDQIKAINEIIAGFEVISSAETEATPTPSFTSAKNQLNSELSRALSLFAESIINGENQIKTAPSADKETAFNYLTNFLMSFASRVATRDRLHIFTTNYDRIIEAGCDLAGIRLVDRFVGSIFPIFRSSRLEVDFHYNPPGIKGEPRYLEGVARFTKLHGSLDWVESDGFIRRAAIPFGATSLSPFLEGITNDSLPYNKLMIYPNAAKDRETSEYPYVDLFRDLAAASCRPNSVVITYGYSFGDEHINRLLSDMLTIPSTHIVIIAYSDPLGRIKRFYETSGRPAQISLLIGDQLGDLKTLVDNFLPKPAIDRTTIRMAELLRSRGLATAPTPKGDPI